MPSKAAEDFFATYPVNTSSPLAGCFKVKYGSSSSMVSSLILSFSLAEKSSKFLRKFWLRIVFYLENSSKESAMKSIFYFIMYIDFGATGTRGD